MQGKIIKGISGFYYVHVVESGIYECKAKGIFRKDNVKPLPGDDVEISVLDEAEKEGNIDRLLKRKNEIIRPAAANIDGALIVFSVKDPEPNLNLLDRFLVYMGIQDIPVTIFFNKTDLDDCGSCDRMKEKFDGVRPDVDTENPDITFHVHVHGNEVRWYADFSGEALHMRGYRLPDQTDALLKEHLAAALILRSEWKKTLKDDNPGVFMDPFCGSGTIAIEAALMASCTAPGLIRKRPYAFERLPGFDQAEWDALKAEAAAARQKAIDERDIRIYASDVSKRAVRIAEEAARNAGVDGLIDFSVKDFTKFTEADCPSAVGYIVTDPPYGERMKVDNLDRLYSGIGTVLQNVFKGWRATILTGASDQLSKMAELTDATSQYLSQLSAISEQMDHLRTTTESLNRVSEVLLASYQSITDNSENITRSSQGYVGQMENLNRNINGLNTIYEIQLKSISTQLENIDRVNRGLTDIRDMYEKSAAESASYCDEAEKMARYMKQLNSVYEKMVKAMTVNMYRPVVPGMDLNNNDDDNKA